MKTNEMEYAIFKHFNGTGYPLITTGITRNVSIVNHECDILMVSKSNYLTEIEIKVSLGDLKKDFLKKHTHKDEKIKYQYYAIPEELYKYKNLIPERFGLIVIHKKTIIETYMKKIPLENTYYRVQEVRKVQNPDFKGHKISDSDLLNLYRLHSNKYWSGKLRELKYKGLYTTIKREDLVSK